MAMTCNTNTPDLYRPCVQGHGMHELTRKESQSQRARARASGQWAVTADSGTSRQSQSPPV
jgi:hypothetical protein